MNKDSEDFEDTTPERPLECSECKKPIAVYYTEIIGDNIVHTAMCQDCPVLQQKLHGINPGAKYPEQEEKEMGLVCGNCGTTLKAVMVGTALGCNQCYEVFGDVIQSELIAENKIPVRRSQTKKTAPLHIGRGPGETHELTPTLRLIALNEALNETLAKEDYEQAAWLRDQINELTKEAETKNE